MASLGQRVRAYFSLGPSNLARVGAYRLGLKTGTHLVTKLKATPPLGPFFRERLSPPPAGATSRQDWREKGVWFGFHEFPCQGPPDWHLNPFTKRRANSSREWYAIVDFDREVGDIKAVWEASRFDWLLAMAQRAAEGEADELQRLNGWLADWSASNPPFRGANWKCGQEASIRVMHLALAALILDQRDAPEPGLIDLLRVHLVRIMPTLSYAEAQQNNHAVSEAAALFIGGTWLNRAGNLEGVEFARLGRRSLNKQARRLIGLDGSFSQYSLVYHRLMVDTYCLAETWRRQLGLEPFEPVVKERLRSATLWLQQLTSPKTGDGPNLGANDGSRLMGLVEPGYRDFRPTLQWASALFLGRRALWQAGNWDQPLLWLGVPQPDEVMEVPRSATLDNGGLHVLRQSRAVAYLRYPRFRFRPSQADLLHVDLWIDGQYVLRDAGTFSYSPTEWERDYYSGTESHNTVHFDGRDQMPRISRFLFGAWPKSIGVKAVHTSDLGVEAAAGYRDWKGAKHYRHILLERARLTCTDTLSGAAKRAVLRWRLRPGNWRINGMEATDGKVRLIIETNSAARLRLTEGRESRFYLHESPIPVLEIMLSVPTRIQTTVAF
ncbi:MAG: heparinase II/III-family protein [Sphingomonas sp.]|nr:heparinase II/III-family protein [Sphingomonas sp.]